MKRNSKILIVLAGVAVVMFVFGFLNVPLFKMFCDSVGISLSPNAKPTAPSDTTVDLSRPLKVLFTTTVNDNLPVLFEASKKSASLHVGEQDNVLYHFVNLSEDTLYFRPVHSVFPAAASRKYTMLQCFCFRDMTLLPHEDVTVPLVFYFEHDLDRAVTRVTMHYTLFKRERTPEEVSGQKDFVVKKDSL